MAAAMMDSSVQFDVGRTSRSRPRDITAMRSHMASYSGSTDTFDFYLDGVYQSSLSSADFTGGYLTYTSNWQNKVNFGDSTTGGFNPDYNADYYFIRGYDTAVPEPATLTLFGLGSLAALRYRRKV